MMKQLNFLLALCIALLFTACATDIENIEGTNTPKGEKKKMVFTAEKAPIDPSSRATIADDYSILWEEGDIVTVFDGTNSNTFTLTSGAGTTCAQFEGEALEADRYVALFGGLRSVTLNENTLNNIYIYSSGQAHKNDVIMIAVCDDNNKMLFKNVMTYAKITTLEPVKKIGVIGGNSDLLTGFFNLSFDDSGNVTDIMPFSSTIKNYNYVLRSYNNETGTFYIPFAPTTLGKLDVVIENESGTYFSRSISHEIHNFESASTVIDFGTVSKENGWKYTSSHQEEVCVHHYSLSQGKEQAKKIDLGLPSRLKWSSVNLGATSPEKYGDYYAWGATVPWLESYDQDGNVASITITYAYMPMSPGECKWNPQHTTYLVNTTNLPFLKNNYTSYQWNPDCWSKYFPGVDTRTVLEPEDDAAVQQWGEGWRMPTDKEYEELVKNCYWEWINNYNGTGISGVLVYKAKQPEDKGVFHNGTIWKKVVDDINIVESTQPTGFIPYSVTTDENHIFLPMPGYCYWREIKMSGEDGNYWTSTLSLYDVNHSYSNNARSFFFNYNGLYSEDDEGNPWNKVDANTGRVYGLPIRPVHE